MSDDHSAVNSESWTGKLPKAGRKAPTKLQALLWLAVSVPGVLFSAGALYEGIRDQRITVPLDEWHHTVPLGNHLGYAACVIGWLLCLLLMAASAFGTAVWLWRSRKC